MQAQYFQDFDAFVEKVRGVDSVMLLQNPQRRFWSINTIKLPEVNIQLGRLGSGNIVEGQSWSSGYLLYMPLTDSCSYAANGTVLDQNSFVILEPGCEFCISTKVEHDWCSIFVPSQLFDHIESSDSKNMTCRVTRVNFQLTHQLQEILRQIMIAAEHAKFESSFAAKCAEAELLKVVSLLIEQQQRTESQKKRRPKVSRQEIILHCRTLIEERDSESILVGELATNSGVSERTLRTAFNEYYGVGPIRYLQLRQIHLVHLALRVANPETESVTDVLLRHGQWEFGRFAKLYQQLYGELPSETLRAKSP